MATKTFKIGECCKGGIITVETKKNKVAIIAKDWDYSQGTKKGSNQNNAKEFDRVELDFDLNSSERNANNFLHDLTTSYYAGQVMEFIESKIDVDRGIHW
tara:strand:- start:103 stop:402 length:300 start_codon:yes stop_codon:yes gene_type:complete